MHDSSQHELHSHELACFEATDVACPTNYVSAAQTPALTGWIAALSVRPELPGQHMVYYEDDRRYPGTRIRSRIKNIFPFHAELDTFVRADQLIDLASTLLREGAILFKEKINFKLPGSDGFKAHQDI